MSDDDFVQRMNRAADDLPTVTVPTAKVRTLARRRRARQALVAGGLCVAASGAIVLGAAALGPKADQPPSTTAAEEVMPLDQWLRQAREDDRVSDAQLTALELSASSGYMTYEQIDALLEDTATCMTDAGVRFDRGPDDELAPGIVMPSYTHGDPLDLADACLFEHSHYAWGAYQTQPRHREAHDAALTQRLPEVMACLRDRGADIPDDATLDEVRATDLQVFIDYIESSEENDQVGEPMGPCISPPGP